MDGEGTFTYRFFLFSPQEINSVRLRSMSPTTTWLSFQRTIKIFRWRLSAPGNIKDETNRRVHRFEYGELTDEATMGFDLQTTLLGFSIEAERAWYVQTKQYPLLSGKRAHRTTGAWFIDVNRNFGPVTWRSEVTRIAPFYTARNFIDDNDDDDPYADSREPEILISGNTKDDLDGDRVKDWDDDFLLFFADPPSFRLVSTVNQLTSTTTVSLTTLRTTINRTTVTIMTRALLGTTPTSRLNCRLWRGFQCCPDIMRNI